MIHDKITSILFYTISALCIVLSMALAFVLINSVALENTISSQNQEIEDLKNEVIEYDNAIDNYEIYIYWSEKFYELKIENELLKQQIKNSNGYILVENINVGIGEFIGINAYGNGKTYMVVLVENEELETINLGNYIYVMGENVIVVKLDDIYYSIPLSKL